MKNHLNSFPTRKKSTHSNKKSAVLDSSDIQSLTGQSNLATVSRMVADSAALTEGILETIAKSNLPILNGVPESILAHGNFAGKVYAGGAIGLDLINAGAEFYAHGWTGEVTYNLGSAGVNAFALYSGSRWAKGFSRHPAVGLGVGAGAFVIGGAMEYGEYRIRERELRWLNEHLDRTESRYQLANQRYSDENCSDFD